MEGLARSPAEMSPENYYTILLIMLETSVRGKASIC